MTALAMVSRESDPHAGVATFASYRAPIRARCEVLVIGSGPGGAVVAKELAEAGKDVLLVEEGPPFAPKEFRPEAGSALRRTFREGGMRVARGNGYFPTMQAIGLGGGSLVNSAISVRAPSWALDKWAERHGVKSIHAGALDDDYAAVEAFLGIAPTEDAVLGERNRLFQRGCDALGWSSAPTPRNVRGCKGSAECFTGCRNGAKQSTDISYVPAAIRAGARVLTSVRIDALTGDARRVTGARGRIVAPFTGAEGDTVEIVADTVVIAAGCMATPCILAKSGIGTASGHVGRHLHGHPGLAVCGLFDHPVDPWTGATQGYHSLQFLDEGMKLEVLWAPPAILSVRFPGFGRELKDQLMQFDRTAPFDVFVNAGHSEGTVRPPTFGKQPDIRFQLDQRDVDLLKRGLGLLGDICWAAGATAVLPGVHGVPEVLRSRDDQRALEAHPMRATDATIGMNHVFGTTRMGDDPKESVVDGFGRVHETRNLWVADTGVFAGSPAVNPMLTCMALARRTARAITA